MEAIFKNLWDLHFTRITFGGAIARRRFSQKPTLDTSTTPGTIQYALASRADHSQGVSGQILLRLSRTEYLAWPKSGTEFQPKISWLSQISAAITTFDFRQKIERRTPKIHSYQRNRYRQYICEDNDSYYRPSTSWSGTSKHHSPKMARGSPLAGRFRFLSKSRLDFKDTHPLPPW